MPSPERLAVELFEELDGYAHLRNALRRLADMREEWAGVPCPVTDQRLVIEPTYPHAAGLMETGAPEVDEVALAAADEAAAGYKRRTRFWSHFRRAWVEIFETPTGKVDWGLSHGEHPVTRLVNIIACSAAWGIEQEGAAMKLLGTLVRHTQFKDYLLTGTFGERSKRSGVFYLFRRLRPTVVVDPETSRVLCTLCMHPIGYYRGTYAGAMAPTDEIVAHLMLMRGDERMYWRRANQHPAWAPESGLF